jgi:hypothetical protein
MIASDTMDSAALDTQDTPSAPTTKLLPNANSGFLHSYSFINQNNFLIYPTSRLLPYFFVIYRD